METKKINEYDPVLQDVYRTVGNPRCGALYCLQNLKVWCFDHGCVLSVHARREASSYICEYKIFDIDELPSVWDDFVVRVSSYNPLDRIVIVTIRGFVVPNSARDLGRGEYDRLCNVVLTGFAVALAKMAKDFQWMVDIREEFLKVWDEIRCGSEGDIDALCSGTIAGFDEYLTKLSKKIQIMVSIHKKFELLGVRVGDEIDRMSPVDVELFYIRLETNGVNELVMGLWEGQDVYSAHRLLQVFDPCCDGGIGYGQSSE